MPGTEELAVSRAALEEAFAERCTERYTRDPICYPLILFVFAVFAGTTYVLYRYVVIESIAIDWTELCYDPVAECEILNATYLGIVGCADTFSFRYKLPDLETVFGLKVAVGRPQASCGLAPNPAAIDITVGLRTCFKSNGLCPEDTIFCAGGGSPCTSLFDSISGLDQEWRALYVLLVLGGYAMSCPGLCVAAAILQDIADCVRFRGYRCRRRTVTEIVGE